MRNYPQTLTFLIAYLFYNDGIQTVITQASTYGEKQLKFDTSVLIGTILLVQFVAFGGALLFGRLASRLGSHKVILVGLGIWSVIVIVGFFLPEQNLGLFLLLAVGIGIVLGGTQALSRSLFSQLIPPGREAEYFSLYQAAERGTSWFGAAGLRHRPADHRLLPPGDPGADRVLRPRRAAVGQGRPEARHPGGGQPPPPGGLSRHAQGRDPPYDARSDCAGIIRRGGPLKEVEQV